MIREYLKIALRNLRHDGLGNSINIFGLTIGLTVCMLISTYVWIEFHYDRFHPFADRTYRILGTAKFGGNDIVFTGLHESFGTEAKRTIPEVEACLRIYRGQPVSISTNKTDAYKDDKIGFADQNALSYLGFSLKSGNQARALAEPGQIIVTEKLAFRLFHTKDVLGKAIIYDQLYPLTITGVLDKIPDNSIFDFNAIVSLASMKELGEGNQNLFASAGFLDTYVLLRPGANLAGVEKMLNLIKAGPQFPDMVPTYRLENITDLHLFSRSITADHLINLRILFGIALTVLLLAVINYVSLTTARGTRRAKEIGIRKIVGGSRLAQIGQLFLESLLVTTTATLLAIAMLWLALPAFRNSLDAPFDVSLFKDGQFYGIIVAIWAVCSLSAGLFPALRLSAYQPSAVINGKLRQGKSGTNLRKIFSLIQFTVSIALIIASVTIYRQMNYVTSKDLGLSRSQVVAIQIGNDKSLFAKFRSDLKQGFGDQYVAASNTAIFTSRVFTSFLETKVDKKGMMVNLLSVDKTFFSLFNIQWVLRPEGFDLHQTSDLTVFNRALTSEADLSSQRNSISNPFDSVHIAGIVADFYIGSLHSSVAPAIVTVVSDTNRVFINNGAIIYVKLPQQAAYSNSIERLRNIYKSTYISAPFEYYFVDDLYNSLYKKERRMANLVTMFSFLSIIIAILGLVSLVTYNIQARVKEIGVRKILGASTFSVVFIFLRDFLQTLGVATVIAIPASWYFMDIWLKNFSSKIDQEPLYFLLPVLCIAILTLSTILLLTIRAARINPVESLKTN